MIIQFTPFVILLLLAGILSALLTVIGWNNRALPVAKPFILLMAGLTIWIFGSAFEMMSTQLGAVLLINNIEYPAMMVVPVALLLISLVHTGREEYLTRVTVPLLFLVPALVSILVITNPWHYLYYQGFHEVVAGGTVFWVYEHGPLFWIMIAYNYSVGFIALVLAAARLFSPNNFYRRQTIIIVFAACIPFLVNLAYIFRLRLVPDFDLTQLAFLLTGIVLAVGLLRYELFSAVPVAYSRVFSTINDAVFVTDSRFRVIDLNPAAASLAGVKSSAAVGQELGSLVPQMAEIPRQPPADRENREGEIVIAGEGGTRYFDVLVTPLTRDRTGSVGYLCIFRDVTGRKNSELALAAANTKINLLTRITRHDLENKMMVLHGYIALLKKTSLSPTQVQYVDRQENALNAMREQIEFSRKYQQLGSQTPVWQNVEALVRHAKTQVFFNRVAFSCTVRSVEIFADSMLERVFYNLLDNAIQHGGDRLTEVTVTSRMDGEYLVIAVQDNGTGIDASQKTKLFEQGFGKNTGLGLFLSREILSITGIGIDETGLPGGGARFEIRVPPGKFRFTASVPATDS